jgi:hypothetical protein
MAGSSLLDNLIPGAFVYSIADAVRAEDRSAEAPRTPPTVSFTTSLRLGLVIGLVNSRTVESVEVVSMVISSTAVF